MLHTVRQQSRQLLSDQPCYKSSLSRYIYYYTVFSLNFNDPFSLNLHAQGSPPQKSELLPLRPGRRFADMQSGHGSADEEWRRVARRCLACMTGSVGRPVWQPQQINPRLSQNHKPRGRCVHVCKTPESRKIFIAAEIHSQIVQWGINNACRVSIEKPEP